jgi:hypothetical protein
LAKGALPITGQDGVWVIEHRYGLEADEIVENVVTRWLSEGMRDPDVEDVWFGPAAFLGK